MRKKGIHLLVRRGSRRIALAVALLALASIARGALAAEFSDRRVLRKEIVVEAPLAEVWRAWTTNEGSRFASGRSNIELEIGGPFEWFLDLPADERGHHGGQGSRVLAFLPGEMLAFDWTFPPAVPALRNADRKTQVVLLFDDLGDGGVRVRFAQHGWGDGEDWDAGWAYFDAAWDSVLERLKATLERPRDG